MDETKPEVLDYPHILRTWRFGDDLQHISRKLTEEAGEVLKLLNRIDLKQKKVSELELSDEVGDLGYYTWLYCYYSGYPPNEDSKSHYEGYSIDPIIALFNLMEFGQQGYLLSPLRSTIPWLAFLVVVKGLGVDLDFTMRLNEAKLNGGTTNGWDEVKVEENP